MPAPTIKAMPMPPMRPHGVEGFWAAGVAAVGGLSADAATVGGAGNAVAVGGTAVGVGSGTVGVGDTAVGVGSSGTGVAVASGVAVGVGTEITNSCPIHSTLASVKLLS